ncbi:MAG TPA: glycosyltransferase [Pyrinomonadaceae bacterium]|nr:glycosyltransferase [Pyrinomonadaceae bacterium]
MITVRIAYLINQYPAISHSFIRREILALEELGFEIMRISLRGWDRELVDESDLVERKRTLYVLRAGSLHLLLAFARMLVLRPVRLMRAIGVAWRMSRPSERPFFVHLVYVAEACRIERWLRRAGIKHVHAHFGTNSAEVAMQVHILGGPTWSFTVHGPEEYEKAPLLGLIEKVNRCVFVIAISSYGRAQIYRLISPKNWGKIHVVHSGLDPIFRAAPTPVEVIPTRIVCVGRLCPEKGQIFLVEAARRLAAKKIDFQLVLAGDGELRPDLEALIAQYGLDDKIRITGWLTGKQVRDEILAARALVLASFSEGLPVVIMEAMALERPVIATFVAGIPELVRPNEHGWLIPAGDVAALVDAIRSCLDATIDQIRHMGIAGRERVLVRHDVDIEAKKLQELFYSAINNNLQSSQSNYSLLPTNLDR